VSDVSAAGGELAARLSEAFGPVTITEPAPPFVPAELPRDEIGCAWWNGDPPLRPPAYRPHHPGDPGDFIWLQFMWAESLLRTPLELGILQSGYAELYEAAGRRVANTWLRQKVFGG